MIDNPDAVRLLLIDDHPLVRDGLRLRLETVPQLRVVGAVDQAASMVLAKASRERMPMPKTSSSRSAIWLLRLRSPCPSGSP